MSEPSSALSSYRFGLPAWLRGLVRAAERVGGIPWAPPAILVAAQWAAVAAFAGAAEHNGWFYFQGGDQSWHYSSGWLLSEGLLPPAVVGYVWPALLAPIALFAGPNILQALPAIVILQVGVLLPAALLCIYAIATRIGGRLLGFAAGAAWVALPYAAIPLFDPRYHERYVDQFLPQALGLTAMSDFPGMVAILVAATFTFRAFESPRLADPLIAGLAAGLAAGVKPANLLFLPAPLVALALAHRWRGIAVASAGLLPALVTLAVWKQQGLGQIPAFAQPEIRVAAGLWPSGPIAGSLDRYLDLDWGHLVRNEDLVREFFWSVRLLEWAALAGIVAVARRSLPGAALLAGWFLLFLVGKGTSASASVETTSFFRLLMPAFPAFFLLAISVPLLLPRIGGRLAARGRSHGRSTRATWVVAGVLLALAAGPLPVVAAAPPEEGSRVISEVHLNLRYPVSGDFGLRATGRPDGVLLTWRRPDAPGSTFFEVMRGQRETSLLCPERTGVPAVCQLFMEIRVRVSGTRLFVEDPAEEGWVYRVGLVASPTREGLEGDIHLVSPEVAPRWELEAPRHSRSTG